MTISVNHRSRVTIASRGSLALATFFAAAGCGGTQHLADYNFSGRSIAVVYDRMPAPHLLLATDVPDVNGSVRQQIESVVNAGASVAKDVEGARAKARLDSAVRITDVAARFSARTLERASRYLATVPVTDPKRADFILEIEMQRSGFDLRHSSAARLYMDAQATLIDARSGREVWSTTVHSYNRVSPTVYSNTTLPGDIITTASLHTMTVQNMQDALNELAEFSADRVTSELRGGLDKVRTQAADRARSRN